MQVSLISIVINFKVNTLWLIFLAVRNIYIVCTAGCTHVRDLRVTILPQVLRILLIPAMFVLGYANL